MNEVVDTVKMLIKKGLTEDEAMAEVESKLHCSLPPKVREITLEQLRLERY